MSASLKKEQSEKRDQVSLVAGGAGFIGSYLCETLLAQNFKVYCLDNLSTGSKDNIKSLLTNPNFHFIEADITQPLDLLESLENLDSIFHLASLEVGKGEKDFSLETLLVNSTGTRNLLEAAKKFKAKFILVSSGDIYQGTFSSNSLKYFFGEPSEEAVMSQNEAKRFAEALTVEYYKNYRVDASIVRVKDVYGPRMNFNVQNELTRLINQAREGGKLLVRGDGLATLNPTFVSDVVFGLVKVLVGDHKGEVFNLISAEKTTELGLAETLRLISGKLEIVHEEEKDKLSFPPPPLDLENSREKLKWSAKVTLAEGLSSVFQSFREVEPAKMVDFALPIEEVRFERTSTKTNLGTKTWGNKIRIIVFVVSLALIVFTTVIPFAGLVLSTQASSKKLENSFASFESDKVGETNSLANEVIEKSSSADQNLNTIRWIFQLTGQRATLKADEELLFASRSAAGGLKLLSQVNQKLIEAENEADLSKARDLLREANQILIEARQTLDLAQANLDQIDRKKLSPGLGGAFTRVKEINEKTSSNGQSLGESLEETLKELESASTVP